MSYGLVSRDQEMDLPDSDSDARLRASQKDVPRIAHRLSKDRLYKRLLRLNLPEFLGLDYARRLGWSHTELDKYFCYVPNGLIWSIRYTKMLREVEESVFIIPSSGAFKFLDLGCNPGGYTSYILSKNPSAHGVGVSLPPKMGGPPLLLSSDLRKRLDLHLTDLISYRLHTSAKHAAESRLRSLTPIPDAFRDSRLVVMDAHTFLTEYWQREKKISTPNYLWTYRLLVSQIVIMLHSLRNGGTAVMTLRHAEFLMTAQLLLFFKFLFKNVVTIKAGRHLDIHPQFLVVAKGFGRGPRAWKKADYHKAFKELWFQLLSGDNGKGKPSKHYNLDFIATCDEVVGKYRNDYLALAKKMWTKQTEGLCRWLREEGILKLPADIMVSVSQTDSTLSDADETGAATSLASKTEVTLNSPPSNEVGSQEYPEDLEEDSTQGNGYDPAWVLL